MTNPGSRSETPNLQKPDTEENIFTQTGDILKCSKCKYKTKQRYVMLRHFERHRDVREFECRICGRTFKGEHSLRNHMSLHSGCKPFQCDECDGSYRTTGDLLRHVRYKHTHEKPFKCTECSYAAVERSKLARHMKCHTRENPNQCPHCTYTSIDDHKLKHHLRTHTKKPYKCEVCNTEYSQANTLKTHLQKVHSKTDLDKYSCTICHATYPRMFALRFHLQKLHANIGLQKCAECDACFTDRYSLQNHRKTHKRTRMFKCDICPHTAQTKKQFIAHIRQHNSKPFECGRCGHFFLSRHRLIRHEKHHTYYKSVKYICNECGNVYLVKDNLVRHLQNCKEQVSNETHGIQEVNDSPDLLTITKNLKDGEVIVLPEKGGDKYVMIEILPNESNFNLPKTDTLLDEDKDNTLKEFYVEIEPDRLEIKLEVETDVEMTDEDEAPLLGF